MKYAWLFFVSAVAAVLYFLTRKSSVPQGGKYAPRANPLATPAAISQVGSGVNGSLTAADQKTVGAQPDIRIVSEVPPSIVWNPTDITSMIEKNSAPPSSTTFPNPTPSSYVNDNLPVSDLSPTFWAADKVPQNPYLSNGMSGPNFND